MSWIKVIEPRLFWKGVGKGRRAEGEMKKKERKREEAKIKLEVAYMHYGDLKLCITVCDRQNPNNTWSITVFLIANTLYASVSRTSTRVRPINWHANVNTVLYFTHGTDLKRIATDAKRVVLKATSRPVVIFYCIFSSVNNTNTAHLVGSRRIVKLFNWIPCIFIRFTECQSGKDVSFLGVRWFRYRPGNQLTRLRFLSCFV